MATTHMRKSLIPNNEENKRYPVNHVGEYNLT